MFFFGYSLLQLLLAWIKMWFNQCFESQNVSIRKNRCFHNGIGRCFGGLGENRRYPKNRYVFAYLWSHWKLTELRLWFATGRGCPWGRFPGYTATSTYNLQYLAILQHITTTTYNLQPKRLIPCNIMQGKMRWGSPWNSMLEFRLFDPNVCWFWCQDLS